MLKWCKGLVVSIIILTFVPELKTNKVMAMYLIVSKSFFDERIYNDYAEFDKLSKDNIEMWRRDENHQNKSPYGTNEYFKRKIINIIKLD